MVRVILLVFVLLALAVSPALAASGNGLYKPFPASSTPGTAAQAYYAQLGLSLSNRQLTEGTHTPALPAAPALGPSHRAGATPAGLGYAPFVIVGLLALLAGGLAALRGASRSDVADGPGRSAQPAA
jgi:hypothetical protein